MRGPGLPGLAWRNLWRQPRRTLLSLSSIAVGTTLAWMFTAIGDSNFSEMIDLAARLGGGHVTIQHREYLDTPTLSRTVSDASALRRVALEDAEVRTVVSRITGSVMLSTATQSYGAAFIAFDPEGEDPSTLSLLAALHEGRPFRTKDDRGIILGRRLAENLDVELGRKVVFTLTDKNGEIVRDVARVSGTVQTGSPGVDAGLVMFPIGRLRSVLGYGQDEAVQVALFLGDQRRAERVASRIEGQIGDAAALPWYRIQPDLSAFVAMKVASAQFMEVIIALLVAAGIFNTLFVSVMERVREFGIMIALGYSSAGLFALVMLESLWLGLVGLVAALLLTAWPYWYMATTGIDLAAQMGVGGSEIAGVAVSPVMRAAIYPDHAVMIAAAALLATLLAGLYPAWKAGHVEPVQTLRLG